MPERIHSVRITSSNSTITNSNSEYRLDLPTGVNFRGKSVALSQLVIYNSWTNITADNNAFTILFPNAGGTEDSHSVTIPVGTYTYDELNSYLELFQRENNLYLLDDGGQYVYYISLASNHTYYSVTFTFTAVPTALPTGYTNPGSMPFPPSAQTPRVTVPANSTDTVGNDVGFGVVVGFTDNATYPASTQSATLDVNGDLVPQIALVTSVNIICNLVDVSDYSSERIVKTFVPQQASGSLEIIEPNNLLWFPCLGSNVDHIKINLVDQDHRVLSVQDTAGFVCELLIRDEPEQL